MDEMRTRPANRRRAERARLAWATRRQNEHGFSLVEMLVALVILGLIVPGVLFVSRNLEQQTQNIGSTVAGVQEDQTAGQALTPYLRSATAVLADSSSTTLDTTIDLGFDKANAIPNTAELTVQLVNCNADGTSPAGEQTELVTSLTPTLGQTKSVGTYDALCELPAFEYWYYEGTTEVTTYTPGSLIATPSSTVAGQLQISEIVAVTVNVTFLAGPGKSLVGSQSIQSAHYNTTVYLENSANETQPETHLTVVAPTTIVDNQLSVVQAVIAPAPNVGYVSFSITLPSLSEPQTICSDEPVLGGAATCTFKSPGYGAGSVLATYYPPQGNASYDQSASEGSVISYIPTAISPDFTVGAGPQNTFNVGVSVIDALGAGSPQVPSGGTVAFTYYACSSNGGTTTTTNALGACGNPPYYGPDNALLSSPTSSTSGASGAAGPPTASDSNVPVPTTTGTQVEIVASYEGSGIFAPSSEISPPITAP